MMYPAKSLHTAARRYCLERGARLRRRAILERWRAPAVQAMPIPDAFGVAGVPDGILWHLDQWTPGDHEAPEDVRARILAASHVLSSEVTIPPAVLLACETEGQRFRRFVEPRRIDELPAVEPLGFCRSLSAAKSPRVRAQLAARWGIAPREHYCYPLIGRPPSEMLALQSEYCYLEVPPAALQEMLYRHGVTKVWVVTEFGPSAQEPDKELDTDRFDLAEVMGSGVESYAASKEDDWLIYVSHEHSITFAGAWLGAAVPEFWPAWSRRTYVDYMYTGQMRAAPELQAADHWCWFLEESAAGGRRCAGTRRWSGS
jgi:hypothetical protein